MDISQILQIKFPNSQWALSGNDYSGLEWLDNAPKPTEEQLLTLWGDVKVELFNKNVEAQRQLAYRQESDPIFFQWQRGESTEQEWIAAIEKIKEKFPYFGN